VGDLGHAARGRSPKTLRELKAIAKERQLAGLELIFVESEGRQLQRRSARELVAFGLYVLTWRGENPAQGRRDHASDLTGDQQKLIWRRMWGFA